MYFNIYNHIFRSDGAIVIHTSFYTFLYFKARYKFKLTYFIINNIYFSI